MDADVSRSGGLYLPPQKVARLAELSGAQGSPDDTHAQRVSWERLRKTINGCVNKVNASNLAEVIEEIFQVNLIRGRGLLVRALLKSQMTAPTYTPVFAAFAAVVNSRIPDIGLLLLQRLVLQFRRAQMRQDRGLLITSLKFLAHTINQRMLNDVAALELCEYLLSPEGGGRSERIILCCAFLREVGAYLEEELSKGLSMISNQLHTILSEGEVEEHVQYEIENFFKLRRDHFAEHPALTPALDLLEPSDRVTHELQLFGDDAAPIDRQEMLDIFQSQEPSQYRCEEEKWKELSREILGGDDNSADGDEQLDEALDELDEEARTATIVDKTEQDTLNLRKTIYLCIMSSLNFEESVHKLLKMNLRPGDEHEIATMLIDCCSIDRTFNRSLAMQAERLCFLDPKYRECFSQAFYTHYQMVHRFETNNLRNIAKFFSHLIASGAIPPEVFSCIRLTEVDTTAASRIFIKVLLQDLVDAMGMNGAKNLIENNRPIFDQSVLLREEKTAARFCVNFFTAIGLADLATELRSTIGG